MSLQWGRRLSTTEIWSQDGSSIGGTVASMGPSSFNDGDCVATTRPAAGQFTLQWGRRLSTTEIAPLSVTSHPLPMLQWGRRLSTTEISVGNPEFGDLL